MPWEKTGNIQIEKPGTGSGGGPNPVDDFRLRMVFAESNAAPVDSMAMALALEDTVAPQSDSARVAFTLTDLNIIPTDDFSRLLLGFAESNPVPADNATFLVYPTYNDTNVAPDEAIAHIALRFSEAANPAPTEGRSATATWAQGGSDRSTTGTWTGAGSAMGMPDGVYATFSDSATATSSGTITLIAFPDPVADFSSWTITRVRFLFYQDVVLSAATTARCHLEYSIGAFGAGVTMESMAVSANNLAIPRVFDRTADRAWTWADINNLQARIRYVTSLAIETATLTVDAIVVEVTATKNPL